QRRGGRKCAGLSSTIPDILRAFKKGGREEGTLSYPGRCFVVPKDYLSGYEKAPFWVPPNRRYPGGGRKADLLSVGFYEKGRQILLFTISSFTIYRLPFTIYAGIK
ncbi:MAG: hypothetical protein LBU44_08975, partial [Mediterranea sp.]|nr:hypothetical protein [Mediterranea sp.]